MLQGQWWAGLQGCWACPHCHGPTAACLPPTPPAIPRAARLEAVIDFGEDDGIGDDVAAGVAPLVRALRREVEGHLAAAASGELIR